MTDRDSLLRRLDREESGAQLRRLRGLLEREDTRLVGDLPSKVSVAEARRLWTTRLRNTDVTGQRLDGVESFITRLKELTPQKKLEQFAVVGREAIGNVFFDGATQHFVGAVIVKQPKR
jgi:hypothetical protein